MPMQQFQWMLPLISQQMFEVLHFSWAEGEKQTEPDRINIIEKPWPFFYNKSWKDLLMTETGEFKSTEFICIRVRASHHPP